ncbi:uncharacterized protein LOC128297411 [Anopheles moucheti]|uniref:uncharacterized protein LOC128297411 n=1 Tax=Anopheles moucheti TaxID=186751 RepID=UPI0022F118F2|nr:uncharacterized protein LOC128297411 [Anopheles moucheti]
MNTSGNVNLFQWLPTEMICYIFDYLDLDTLKSVSLTCRRMERIFSRYCCLRFTLYIENDRNLLPWRHRSSARTTQSAESAAELLMHSTRYFQKVYLPVYSEFQRLNPDPMGTNCILYKVLETDWLQQLVVLKLVMGSDSLQYAGQISTAVRRMDQLQELQFMQTMYMPNLDICEDLRIESNTLQWLVLEVSIPSVINCPKLRKLDVASYLEAETYFGRQYAQHGDGEPFWKLKQLEEFTIMNQSMFRTLECTEHRPGYKFKFYNHLTQLKKLHLYVAPVSEKFLQSICESCVHLEDLFICTLQAIDPNSLRYLSNLPHLRRLAIWFTMTPHPVSFASVNVPKLEHLTLGMVDVVWKSLEKFQSIKSLSLIPHEHYRFLNALCFVRLMKQLEFLWLDFRCIRDLRSIPAVLQELPLLRTLILENVDVRWIYLSEMPPLPQLNRLVLYRCTASQFWTLDARLFPNVKQVELAIPKCFSCDYKQRCR